MLTTPFCLSSKLYVPTVAVLQHLRSSLYARHCDFCNHVIELAIYSRHERMAIVKVSICVNFLSRANDTNNENSVCH